MLILQSLPVKNALYSVHTPICTQYTPLDKNQACLPVQTTHKIVHTIENNISNSVTSLWIQIITALQGKNPLQLYNTQQ